MYTKPDRGPLTYIIGTNFADTCADVSINVEYYDGVVVPHPPVACSPVRISFGLNGRRFGYANVTVRFLTSIHLPRKGQSCLHALLRESAFSFVHLNQSISHPPLTVPILCCHSLYPRLLPFV